MPETNWGRKETIIWPPHKPIYTFGAVFFAVVLTGLFVYLHFAFVLTPLQQFDLPIYIKTTILASKSLTHYEFSFHSFSTSRSGTHRTTEEQATVRGAADSGAGRTADADREVWCGRRKTFAGANAIIRAWACHQ